MYNEYFGLKDAPFSIAPDPRYLYMSEQHREALAHLVFGMSTGGGFVLLTGEVGTGKTTVCRCLLEQVPEDANVALILNPKVKAYELLATICDELGIYYPEGEKSIKAFVDLINRYLLDEYAKGRKTVVILEEAQNLGADVLEQLRLLTNLETNERKLLQIVMLGQPELLEMLASNSMRQLSQRITARYHLNALSRKEVDEYVSHRLSVAGFNRTLFPESTLRMLYRLSGGIPRRINLLCDRALLGAYVNNRNQVDGKILKKAAQEVLGEEDSFLSRIRNRTLLWPSVLMVLLLMVFFGAAVFHRQDLPWVGELLNTNDQKQELTQFQAPASIPALDKDVIEKVASVPEKIFVSEKLNEEPAAINRQAVTTDIQIKSEEKIKKPALIQKDISRIAEFFPQGLSTASTPEKAYISLLKLWGAGIPENMVDPCKQAGADGLGCLFMQGNMKSIAHMNRPVILKLLDKKGQPFYVTLVALQNDVATIVLEDKKYRLRVSDLEENWLGEYTFIWKLPPGSDDGAIHFGEKGPHVLWLASSLALAQSEEIDVAKSDEFNIKLSEKIESFQRSRGLLPDGLASPVTLLHLNSVTDSDIPLLTSRAR